MAAGLGTSFRTKERIIVGTKMDAGKERLTVEMGKLTIQPWKEEAAETRNQSLLVVWGKKGWGTGMKFKLSEKGKVGWLQIQKRA